MAASRGCQEPPAPGGMAGAVPRVNGTAKRATITRPCPATQRGARGVSTSLWDGSIPPCPPPTQPQAPTQYPSNQCYPAPNIPKAQGHIPNGHQQDTGHATRVTQPWGLVAQGRGCTPRHTLTKPVALLETRQKTVEKKPKKNQKRPFFEMKHLTHNGEGGGGKLGGYRGRRDTGMGDTGPSKSYKIPLERPPGPGR